MNTRVLSLLLVLVATLSFASAQVYQCSSICVPDFPVCQVSECDLNNGVCVDMPIQPVPVGCCRSTTDCLQSDPCVLGQCNFDSNTCEYETICSDSDYVDDQLRTCATASDCDDDDNCSAEKCINGFCVTSPNPSTSDPNCCQEPEDCPVVRGRLAFCSRDRFRCVYVVDPNFEETEDLPEEEPVEVEEESESEEDEDPGVGDIIGAIIGFIILGVLVLAFVIVVVLMIIQKIIRKLTSEN